tara:strand:- start:754 stop:921 length:168 start_codon:yes stop_codon:yes gene_type:complete
MMMIVSYLSGAVVVAWQPACKLPEIGAYIVGGSASSVTSIASVIPVKLDLRPCQS